MLGDLFSRLFSSKPKEPPPPLPMHAEGDLEACLRDARVDIRREAVAGILEAMRQRRKIEAIKILRANSTPSLGLKEAKDLVEALENRLKSSRDRFGR